MGHGRSRGSPKCARLTSALPFLRARNVEHRRPSLFKLSRVNGSALAPKRRTHPRSPRHRTRRHAAWRDPRRYFLRTIQTHNSEQDAQHASPNHASPNRAANSRAHLSTGVGWAIFAALGFGVLFWFLGFHVVPAVGSAVSVWVMRLTALVSLALAAAPAHETLRLPSGKVWWLLLAVGILDTAAFVANNAGLSTGQVSVVSVLASLYGAFTVLLAWIFLRERLERSQWLGIVLIFIGIVLVSI